jgi:hypothetical protein
MDSLATQAALHGFALALENNPDAKVTVTWSYLVAACVAFVKLARLPLGLPIHVVALIN